MPQGDEGEGSKDSGVFTDYNPTDEEAPVAESNTIPTLVHYWAYHRQPQAMAFSPAFTPPHFTPAAEGGCGGYIAD